MERHVPAYSGATWASYVRFEHVLVCTWALYALVCMFDAGVRWGIGGGIPV